MFFFHPPTIVQAVFVLVGGSGLAAAFTDAHWAAPLNTVLLIILSIVARYNGREIKSARVDVNNAAQAAASAAAAAADAARIAREVGAHRRGQRKDLPPGPKE